MGKFEPYGKVMTLIDNGGSLQLTVPKAVVSIFGLGKGDRLRVQSDPLRFADSGLVLEAYLEDAAPQNTDAKPLDGGAVE